MKHVEVYRFLKRVQQRLKAKKIENAVEFVVNKPFLTFCSEVGESHKNSMLKNKWMDVRHVLNDYGWKKKLEDWGKLIDVEKHDTVSQFIEWLNISRWQKIKTWFWLRFSRDW